MMWWLQGRVVCRNGLRRPSESIFIFWKLMLLALILVSLIGFYNLANPSFKFYVQMFLN